jgi:hypothetical protein
LTRDLGRLDGEVQANLGRWATWVVQISDRVRQIQPHCYTVR